MLHIRPVREDGASPEIQRVYADIKQTFGIELVPLVFQYIAGFQEYFFYVWEKIKQNVQSDFFVHSTGEVISFSRETIPHIYHPSRAALSFVDTLHPEERNHIGETVSQLERVNANLFLITIGMREGLKGIDIGKHLLKDKTEEITIVEEVFDQFINNNIMRQNLREQQELQGASKMLAPLFGASNLMISRYPEFFGKIAEEMDHLVRTEFYLSTRVGLERLGILTVNNLAYPLGTSYRE
ncbi:MAG TPA: hypothetical protein VN711_05330, partial [Candidatus Saccharimonadales bacterium]|nr:hypothetical protein [Candidatus Saccharimonadales bacterium]